jgi:hypothetical protein
MKKSERKRETETEREREIERERKRTKKKTHNRETVLQRSGHRVLDGVGGICRNAFTIHTTLWLKGVGFDEVGIKKHGPAAKEPMGESPRNPSKLGTYEIHVWPLHQSDTSCSSNSQVH